MAISTNANITQGHITHTDTHTQRHTDTGTHTKTQTYRQHIHKHTQRKQRKINNQMILVKSNSTFTLGHARVTLGNSHRRPQHINKIHPPEDFSFKCDQVLWTESIFLNFSEVLAFQPRAMSTTRQALHPYTISPTHFLLIIWDKVLLSCLGCPWTPSVIQAALNFSCVHLPGRWDHRPTPSDPTEYQCILNLTWCLLS